jgi:hypothetical protein
MAPGPPDDAAYQPVPLSAEEYTHSEITRWLHRVEIVIGELRNEVVSRSVYEVEQRHTLAELAELKVVQEKDRLAAQGRHEKLVARMWWVVATAITSMLGFLGLLAAVAGLILKGD